MRRWAPCCLLDLQHRHQKTAAPLHGITSGVTITTPFYQELSWEEPMPRLAEELILLLSCHLHWGEGRRNHCQYSYLTSGNSCLSSVQSASKQHAECVINVLKVDTGSTQKLPGCSARSPDHREEVYQIPVWSQEDFKMILSMPVCNCTHCWVLNDCYSFAIAFLGL